MDHRSSLAPPAPAVGPPVRDPVVLEVDQAIFTSIRSPMGEGYRLIAMSPGITSEERAEITRRSPSHGSLCDLTEDAVGLMTYPLPSERRCLAWSQYAGREHTARGGGRVYTRIVLLEREAYRRFENNPLCVWATMVEALGTTPDLKPAVCLEPVTLCWSDAGIDHRGPAQTGAPTIEQLRQACLVASIVLADQPVIINSVPQPLELLGWVMEMLPSGNRAALSVSCGLNYSPVRQTQLTLVDQPGADLQRSLQGRDVQVVDLASNPAKKPSLFDSWFDLVLDRAAAGRLAELGQLASRMEERAEPGVLSRIVELCRDIDRLADADQELLEALVGKHTSLKPASATEAWLVRRLLSAAVASHKPQ